ncbi:Hypothetical protein MIP_00217 [Mycobacterium intracellulare subsp. intracellulare MTCC 9506]|uniref:Uncharacterized protein n=1 Tax=Mycobacterium indicus pranii (strain DSM 45239 / MTCC 9506) TaxID=1232724 RepID=J9W578_MYCIP|nr:Hypothetical protein MIP_00217 [Mycobacterium intracellulare subsp. intracellulare MTCC 9506]
MVNTLVSGVAASGARSRVLRAGNRWPTRRLLSAVKPFDA